MIIFEETEVRVKSSGPKAPGSTAGPYLDALSKGVIRSYGDKSFGYLLRVDPKRPGAYRYIRLEEEAKNHLSRAYSTRFDALEGIFFDSQRDGQVALKNSRTKPWIGTLLQHIKAEASFDENSPRGRATARFAKRTVSIYGDAEYGYIIIRTPLGKYRTICYDGQSVEGKKQTISRVFPTELKAMEDAYSDSMRRGMRDLFSSWFSELALDLIAKGTKSQVVISFVGGFTEDFGEHS